MGLVDRLRLDHGRHGRGNHVNHRRLVNLERLPPVQFDMMDVDERVDDQEEGSMSPIMESKGQTSLE